MAAPVVNKRFEDEHDDDVDDGSNIKLIPGIKADTQKMNQIQPQNSNNQPQLRPSMVGSINQPASEERKSGNV